MAGFLIDEDMPRSLAARLRAASLDAQDVRDVGLRGAPDSAVFRHAVTSGLALITGDLGFSNLLHFPLGIHAGILVARIPNEVSTARVNELVLGAIQQLSGEDILGNLVIIEPDRIRLRRAL